MSSLTTLAVQLETDVLAARSGDASAFGRLVDETKSAVTSIALAIVGDYPASQDIAQDVFLAAWRNLGKLRSPASFLPWLRQTTRNRARTWVRDQGRRSAAGGRRRRPRSLRAARRAGRAAARRRGARRPP